MNAILCIIFEGPNLTFATILNLGPTVLLLNAAMAFCLNVAVVLLIGKTSSLVLTLSGVLKDILLVGLSVFVGGATVTLLQVLGYSVALAGLIYYKLGGQRKRQN